MTLAMGTGNDAQAAVFPTGVGKIVRKEDSSRPGGCSFGTVPFHEVLVPIERRAITWFGQNDYHIVGLQTFEAYKATNLPLVRHIDNFLS